ncbi:fumarylacetoacetate hydrolase family protein [Streptomyces sp. NPDC021098]|uniref:fumarylacetoacetate hydrolase family protein n=1 Tax=unclassified Streptomyces TaxID=2593676 RepID=UPI0037876169
MRLATIRHGDGTSAAVVTGDTVAPVRELPGRDDATDVSALMTRPLTPEETAALRSPGRGRAVDDTVWLPPLPRPPKNLFCVGKNYREHVAEGARAEGRTTVTMPAEPIWFTKPRTALLGHRGTLVADPAFTRALDYEGELVLVIGKEARHLTPGNALDHVFGYTIGNDITARDVQQSRTQWFTGKGADGYAPLGPWIVTPDALPDPRNLRIRTRVNGAVRQDDTTANMLFGPADLLADLTRTITLEPGDLVATGTPQGVAWGMSEPAYLRPGDTVEVEIAHLGILSTTIAAPAAARHSTSTPGGRPR